MATSAPDGDAEDLREEGRGAQRDHWVSGPVSYTNGRRPPPSVDTKQKALKVICCWYQPDADHSTPRTKQQWAAGFGVNKRHITYWEERIGDEMLDRIPRGVLPLPKRPSRSDGEPRTYTRAQEGSSPRSTPSTVHLGCLHAYDLDELMNSFRARCSRVGDSRPYGSKGTRGLYREGVQWAASEIVRAKLAADGRRAAEFPPIRLLQFLLRRFWRVVGCP